MKAQSVREPARLIRSLARTHLDHSARQGRRDLPVLTHGQLFAGEGRWLACALALEVNDMAAAVNKEAVKSALAKSARESAAEFISAERWTPGETDLQRGRAALLKEFRKPHNLAVSEYAKRAGVSRQQIYKDLNASPPKLLALRVGKAGQRVPDWQLEERPRELTRLVAAAAPDLDAWTIYHALRTPSGALEGRAPVDAVKQRGQAARSLAMLVLEELGIQAESA